MKKEIKKIFTIEDDAVQMKDTAVFVPIHPIHGKIESLSITFRSPASAEFKSYVRNKQLELIEKMTFDEGKASSEKEADKAKKAKIAENIDNGKKEDITTLASMVVSWGDGYVQDGKPLEPTKENCMAVFSNPKLDWMFDQAFMWFNKSASFFTEDSIG